MENYSSSVLFSLHPLSPSVSHNDLALQLRILHNNRLSQIDLHNVSKVATDITRLQAGHVQAQVLQFNLSLLTLICYFIAPESNL